MEREFKEEQKSLYWWVWAILILVTVLAMLGIYRESSRGEDVGLGLVIFVSVMLPLWVLFFLLKLKTLINEQGIQIHLSPLVKRKFLWEEIKSIKVIDYGFVGGWGIRLGTKYGTVYNMKGSKGLAIELKKGKNLLGKKLLIGTQKETQLKEFLEKLPAVIGVYEE